MPLSKINTSIEKNWKLALKYEFNMPYFLELQTFLTKEEKNSVIYPPKNKMFTAFNLTPFNKIKVVILGQDPYHGENQAHGLSFSVPMEIPPPPSLKNIFKEMEKDIGFKIPNHGNLEKWATQGVLLLNAILSVKKGEAGSHQKKGWEFFTDACIKKISDNKENVVFLLWGNYAKKKEKLIDTNKHLVLKSTHPSPFSARNGFFGCKHFSKTNEYLTNHNKLPIDWSL